MGHYKPVYICLLLAMFTGAVVRAADDCDPPVPGCTCSKGTLSCEGKTITEFPNLTTPHEIHVFMFTDCRLREIKEIPYTNASSIVIRKSSLMKIAENAFSKLTRLTDLSITDNYLENLTALTFANLSSLETLELRDNGHLYLPDGIFDNLVNLKLLDLSENNLNFTDNLFKKPLASLSSLICEKCKMSSINKKVLTKLTHLKSLNLNANHFTILPSGAFQSVPTLEELSLDNCKIERIDVNAFATLSSLSFLNLGNNRLSELSQPTFRQFYKTLKRLYLQDNKFRYMIEDRAPWSNLTELRLGNNPWHCDCMIVWMHGDHFLNIDKENVTCNSPTEVFQKNLFQTESEMICNVSHRRTSVVLAIAIPAILICLSLIGYYVWQIIRTRRRQARQRHAFKYRSIYGETVETSNSKQSILA